MSDCLFCDIAASKMSSDIVHKDDEVVAFRDINPQAPVHILVIPTKHIATANDLHAEDEQLVGKLYTVAKALAQKEGIAQDGYRLVMNCNKGAGQAVFHIHLHLLGGRKLTWPPG
ncbi:histidine triad nucleotide-binding protein [candidate division KSB1 bacterium]|nr:histidine triad nucleotide-binding protein [candidate division KSB1 bacterium]NIR69923.1 histidine triad nucleotide-binding protein [candidate division KSB1 bacterium]NIS25832.1 histidine triad nucleotide-binding protein [candidate division KSB1 bacterium]NIT72707.1 histidine triad nucleotide-binding protein [candidate division KSB1 bacterium]NIU26521.1 histidine triad nucleotide-binding protein [candidate division KSB1 bacterium]